MDKYRTPISAAAVLLSPVSCGASHPGEDTQETLALSIASYKDGPSPLLDVGAQRSVATAQASLARAVQQTAKDHVVPNMARGAATLSTPRSGQLLMNTAIRAIAAIDGKSINPPRGRVS